MPHARDPSGKAVPQPAFTHRVLLASFAADTPARAKFARFLSAGAKLACGFCKFQASAESYAVVHA